MILSRRRQFLITFLIVVFSLSLCFALFSALTDFLDFIPFALIIGISAVCVSASLVTFILVVTFNERSLARMLQVENEYNFGVKSALNNMYTFRKLVENKQKKYRSGKKNQHIIAFTFSNMAITQNVNRSKEIVLLNSHISSCLNELYLQISEDRDNVICAFSRGVFLLYVFNQSDTTIQRICEFISKEIYAFTSEYCQHIWVQPFYGVDVIKKRDNIIGKIENAMLARDYSERNFETVTFYQDDFRKTVSENEAEELTEALEKKEFVVYYQPKYHLASKSFISAEALIRWDSKKYGLLAPKSFLSKAETVGLIHEIDVYVLRQVCEDLNFAIRRGRRVVPISINFSLFEFYSPNFLDIVVNILEEYKIPAHLIQIEITEATSQANQFLSISIIKKLKDKGIRVLMDDFGVGFSNVGNLKKIPFDAVKIDKSFINDITFNVKAREIVRFLIGLCKVNGLEVIAEGVDNKEQVEVLKKNKCDTIQGYFYSKPLPKKQFEQFLDENNFEKKEATSL